jgi:hypothetical protein
VTLFVGACVAVGAAIMRGVAFWSGAREDTSPGGGHSATLGRPRPRRLAQWRLGWWGWRGRWWRLGRIIERRIYTRPLDLTVVVSRAAVLQPRPSLMPLLIKARERKTLRRLGAC